MRKPPPNVLELPLEVRAEMAMKAAVERALEEHARMGSPAYIWEGGRVVKLMPEEIKRRLALEREHCGGDEEVASDVRVGSPGQHD